MQRILLGLAVTGLLLAPAPAVAHVKAKNPEAPAGSRYTFTFEIDHGCAGSPTTAVRILLPDGAFDARPADKPGWTVTVAGEPPVVEWSGGPLPDQTKDAFSVELVTPNRPGEEVLFRTVQRCEVGETPWIDPVATSETPAPRVLLTANAAPITAPSTTTTATSATTTTGPPATTPPDPSGGGGGGGSGGPLIAALAGALAAGALATVAVRRRRRS